MQRIVVVLVVVGLAPSAHADELESRPTWEVDLGFRAGDFRVGSWHPLGLGVQLEAGLRFDRFAVFGETDLMWLPDPSVPVANPTTPLDSGSAQRYGIDARYSLGKYAGPFRTRRGLTSRFLADWWLEAGIGTEKITMLDGSEVDRRDVSFGIGGELGARFGVNRDHRFLGFYALRVTAAQAPNDVEMRCTASCEPPGAPMDYIVSFDWGVAFGG